LQDALPKDEQSAFDEVFSIVLRRALAQAFD